MDTDTQAPTPFSYERPELKHSKAVRLLDRTEILVGTVHVVAEGGETNLHTHPTVDGFWFVLSGRARFYTTDDAVIGDLGPHEGILIPKAFPYWFESSSDEVLEILQVAATHDPARLMEREDLTPRTEGQLQVELVRE